MAAKIQVRRDIKANWVSKNPILYEGEIGLELETTKLKIGNGVTAWNSLPYYGESVPVEVFNGTNGTVDSNNGLVPVAKPADKDKFLKGDGSWGSVSSGSEMIESIPNINTPFGTSFSYKIKVNSPVIRSLRVGPGTVNGYYAPGVQFRFLFYSLPDFPFRDCSINASALAMINNEAILKSNASPRNLDVVWQSPNGPANIINYVNPTEYYIPLTGLTRFVGTSPLITGGQTTGGGNLGGVPNGYYISMSGFIGDGSEISRAGVTDLHPTEYPNIIFGIYIPIGSQNITNYNLTISGVYKPNIIANSVAKLISSVDA